MKKIIQKLSCIVLLSAILLFSDSIKSAASADLYSNFSFLLSSYGGAETSASAKKTNATGSGAQCTPTYISTAASLNLPLTVRVRDVATGNKATVAVGFYKNSAGTPIHLSYYSGYGYQKSSYYLKMQTNSNSTQSATVSGYWRP